MTHQIYLIAPPDVPAARLAPALAAALAREPAAAVLLPRGLRSERDYRELVTAVAPAAQATGAAVLIEGEPGLVRMLKADGLHVTGGPRAIAEATAALKPDFIVGAGNLKTRHAAMDAGEAGVDYVLFGPLSGHIAAAERELAGWWAETMEIPGVLSDPQATREEFDAAGCEFIGLTLEVAETAQ